MAIDVTKKYIIQVDPFIKTGPQGPQGPPGQNVSLPLSSDNVTYNSQTLTQVLNGLLYVPLVISSFTTAVTNYEKGVILTALTVQWTFNKVITSQTITGPGVTPPTLTITDRVYNLVLTNISSNIQITLSANDGTNTSNKGLNINFTNGVYYGKAPQPGTINSVFLQSLTKSLQTSRSISFTISTGSNEYIWYAIPSNYGTPQFLTNGFLGGLSYQSTISYTNPSGYTENYDVYRSNNVNLGNTLVNVS